MIYVTPRYKKLNCKSGLHLYPLEDCWGFRLKYTWRNIHHMIVLVFHPNAHYNHYRIPSVRLYQMASLNERMKEAA